jgi:hypothetical protein
VKRPKLHYGKNLEDGRFISVRVTSKKKIFGLRQEHLSNRIKNILVIL